LNTREPRGGNKKMIKCIASTTYHWWIKGHESTVFAVSMVTQVRAITRIWLVCWFSIRG